MRLTRQTYLILIITIPFFWGCEEQTSTDANGPEACFTLPSPANAGVSLSFDASCSANADSYFWDFGDGEISADANPAHTYGAAGSYSVKLTVTNVSGQAATVTNDLIVEASAVIEHSGTINADETWGTGVHLITDDVYVSGARLTIEPGAIVKFTESTSLLIGYGGNGDNSELIANGTIDNPILFTSNANSPTPGDWDRILFGKGTLSTSRMKYCTINYGGGYGTSSGMIELDNTSVTIENCTISQSAALGIDVNLDSYFESFINNSITNCANFAVELFPDAVHTIGVGNIIDNAMGISVLGGDYTKQNETWLKQTVPYIIQSDVYVGNSTGCVLNIVPGTQLDFKDGSSLMVAYGSSMVGTLIAEGTSTEPIVFTAVSSGGSKMSGSWDRLGFFAGTTSNTSLKYCTIEYGGGYSQSEGMVVVDECSVSIQDCKIQHSDNYGIRVGLDASFSSFINNTLQNNGTYAIKIFANYAHTIGTGNTILDPAGILVYSDDYLQADETWLKQTCPYVIDGDVYIGSSTTAKLTIEPGTVIKFLSDGAIRVGYGTNEYGVLVADGTSSERITFTTNAAAGSAVAGQWYGVFFDNGTSNGSILNNCDFSYGGGYSSQSGMVVCNDTPAGLPVISNCDFSNSSSWAINVSPYAGPQIDNNNTFSQNAMGDVKTN